MHQAFHFLLVFQDHHLHLQLQETRQILTGQEFHLDPRGISSEYFKRGRKKDREQVILQKVHFYKTNLVTRYTSRPSWTNFSLPALNAIIPISSGDAQITLESTWSTLSLEPKVPRLATVTYIHNHTDSSMPTSHHSINYSAFLPHAHVAQLNISYIITQAYYIQAYIFSNNYLCMCRSYTKRR